MQCEGLRQLIEHLQKDDRNNIADIVTTLALNAQVHGVAIHTVYGLRVALVAPPASEKWCVFIRYYEDSDPIDFMYTEGGLEHSSV